MKNFVNNGTMLPNDRNGSKIEINSEVLFKRNSVIGIGKVIGYTENMKYVYILSNSFYKVNVYKRIGKNVIMAKNLNKWKNSERSW